MSYRQQHRTRITWVYIIYRLVVQKLCAWKKSYSFVSRIFYYPDELRIIFARGSIRSVVVVPIYCYKNNIIQFHFRGMGRKQLLHGRAAYIILPFVGRDRYYYLLLLYVYKYIIPKHAVYKNNMALLVSQIGDGKLVSNVAFTKNLNTEAPNQGWIGQTGYINIILLLSFPTNSY